MSIHLIYQTPPPTISIIIDFTQLAIFGFFYPDMVYQVALKYRWFRATLRYYLLDLTIIMTICRSIDYHNSFNYQLSGPYSHISING